MSVEKYQDEIYFEDGIAVVKSFVLDIDWRIEENTALEEAYLVEAFTEEQSKQQYTDE